VLWGQSIATTPSALLFAGSLFAGPRYNTESIWGSVDLNGNTVGANFFVSPNQDDAVHVTKDSLGDIIVTSKTHTLNEDFNWKTIKANLGAGLLWAHQFDGPDHAGDIPLGSGTDSSDCVYTVGNVMNGGQSNAAVVKYNSAGAQQWVQFYAPAGASAVANAFSVDASGNTIIAGDQSDGSLFVVKYGAAGGAPQWTYTLKLTAYGTRALSVALDPSGNICVGGSAQYSASQFEVLTLKLSPAGTLLWDRVYNIQPYNLEGDYINADVYGYVYVAGLAIEPGAQMLYRVGLVRYGPNGSTLWERNYDGIVADGSPMDLAGLCSDSKGNAYLAGDSPQSGYREFLLKYDVSGNQLINSSYGAIGKSYYVSGMAIGADADVYLTGRVEDGTSTQLLLTRWTQSVVSAPDTYSTATGHTLNIAAPGVLANDRYVDPSVTIAVDMLPSHGTLTMHNDGSFSYTPALKFVGDDQFQYHVLKGGTALIGNTVTVTIHVTFL